MKRIHSIELKYFYTTIIAARFPNKILKENQKLLMWYDQAVTRAGGET